MKRLLCWSLHRWIHWKLWTSALNWEWVRDERHVTEWLTTVQCEKCGMIWGVR
jgi:hypothetical protein